MSTYRMSIPPVAWTSTAKGCLLLTDDGPLQARISQPRSKIRKVYWAQVEGVPSDEQLDELRKWCKTKGRPGQGTVGEIYR